MKQIPGQMSLFDLVPQESLETIPEEVMVERIGAAIGVKFIKDKFFGDYRAKVGQSILSLEYDRFNGCFNNEKFIGCGIDDKKNHCGAGAPISSIPEAVEWFMKRKRK